MKTELIIILSVLASLFFISKNKELIHIFDDFSIFISITAIITGLAISIFMVHNIND